ncbi:MAG: protein-L-isoaspartate(D-aspartate) O-methyltransferase [Alphaproteobacteria bacterium]|jgi:protein-L-isoaspartate(D-aspartate) O-methyltransferase|nr:protein-L-isoaspartate(D-aspartate) O-methyltransferase [Alphaproteobacteria bacterium]
MTDTRAISLIMSLRGQGITDQRVLSAIERTPRETFVDDPFEANAYENSALPIACGQTISQPYIVALSTQELEIQANHRVLEIGTGSGYQAAVLAQLCRMVYTVERHKPLMQLAHSRFQQLKLHNIVTRHGDGFQGWPEQAPFDRILLTAAIPDLSPTLIDQLKPGGILVAPVGKPVSAESNSQDLVKIIRTEEGTSRQSLIPVVFVPMVPGLPQVNSDGETRK